MLTEVDEDAVVGCVVKEASSELFASSLPSFRRSKDRADDLLRLCLLWRGLLVRWLSDGAANHPSPK